MKQEPSLSQLSVSNSSFPLSDRLVVDSEENYCKGITPVALGVLILHFAFLLLVSYCLHIPKQVLPLFSSVQIAFEEMPQAVPNMDTNLENISNVEPLLLKIPESISSLPRSEQFTTISEKKNIVHSSVRSEKIISITKEKKEKIEIMKKQVPVGSDIVTHNVSSNPMKIDKDFIKNHCEVLEKVYPLASRRRHEQGTALLSLQISKEGQVKRVSLVTSTGFSDLDNAAIESAKKLSCTVEQGQKQDITASLTISFTLH